MPKSIIFIGDSLTEWFDWQRRFPEYQVTNLGISGEPIEGLLGRRDRIRAQIHDPSFIFLMTGINNIAMGELDILASYREIVRNFTTWYKESILVVESILPVDLPWIDNKSIRSTNRGLEQIAREQNAEYLDLYPLFADQNQHSKSGYLQEDGVHLSSKGYAVWAGEVERFLKK